MRGAAAIGERRLLNMEEARQYIGVAKDTLYTMVSQRRVPYVKVGKLTKFDPRLLDEWISGNTVMPLYKNTKEAN